MHTQKSAKNFPRRWLTNYQLFQYTVLQITEDTEGDLDFLNIVYRVLIACIGVRKPKNLSLFTNFAFGFCNSLTETTEVLGWGT